MNIIKQIVNSRKVPLCFFVFLMVWSVQTIAAQSSASGNITIHVQNQPLEKVIASLGEQTGLKFFYSEQVIAGQRVTLNFSATPLNTVLAAITRQTQLNFSRENNTITISNQARVPETPVAGGPRKVTGVIVDEAGEPVIGANIIEKDSRANGTIAGMDGEFDLELSPNSTIVVSYIGYITQEINIGNNIVINIQLKEDVRTISEVVVTALGIRREEKALGYAVQKVDGEQIASVKGANVATSLTGKIAGLNIKNSTEFAASPELTLRGSTPLLVVDGVPHYNVRLNDIPADDIESVNVLKGSTASALYGSRGGDGAIMVTTKKASKEGLDITVNSNTMFHAGFLKIPEVQTAYSSGGNGRYGAGDYVWGDKLDIGRTAVQYDPYTYEWKEMPLTSAGKNNLENFLEQALVTNNHISIAQKGQYGSVRTSLNHVYNKGQFPNTDQQKITFSVGGEMDWKKFHLDAGVTYNKNFFSNDLGTGYGVGSFLYNLLLWTGAEYDLRDYKNYWRAGKEHSEQNWMDEYWYDNPYFLANERTRGNHYDLTNSYFNLTYDITGWLKVLARVGLDAYRSRTEVRQPISSRSSLKGSYELSNTSGYSTNDDLLLMADKKWGDFNVNGFVGGSIYFRENDEHISATSNGLNMPGFYSLNASIDPATTSSAIIKQQTNSLYGKIGGSWKNLLFLEVTGRNDWVSTLAASERSYFYPSVSGSLILSEFIPLPDVFNFWKIRGSWTQTKYPAGVYDINQSYSVSRNFWGDMTATYYPGSIRDVSLKPQSSKGYEIGMDFRFFNNRLKFDAAYYNKLSYDLQRNASMSYASGFESTLINFGEQQLSRGVEFTLGGDVFKGKDFTWNSTFNWALDRYYYHKLDDMYSTKKPWLTAGADWWWVEVYDLEKDPDGNLINYNGWPRKSDYPTLAGSSNPDWVWGWTNTLRYKNLHLNISLDGRTGGIMFDYIDSRLWHSGRHIDSDNQWRYDEVVDGLTNFIGPGVMIVSGEVKYDLDGNILEDTRVFAPNDVPVSYETYIRWVTDDNQTRPLSYFRSKTFFKLRELSLGYTLPPGLCQSLRIKGAEISLVGQNLLIWTKDFRFSDPDVDTENINSPSIRYVGVNLKLNF
ncbi:MAG: SusC/RagA family TonB-linked outer membrane protein [Tannerellaceae bacterium]|nr:SusC/RagA family TonB-linked outer membrane protein [Tannerellaceae bacterium]